MIIDIKYYSQHKDVEDAYWQPRSCSITCLKMILDYYAKDRGIKEIPTIENLIKEGVLIGGFGKDGWLHDSIVMLAHNHGYSAYRQEFRSMDIDYQNEKMIKGTFEEKISKDGVEKFVRYINSKKPVIVSVAKKFREEDKFHTIVLIGHEEAEGKLMGFYYHDPDAVGESDGAKQYVDIETFKKYWRKFAIFVTT